MTLTRELVAAGRRIDARRLPDDARTVATHCVLDWLGVTLAGAAEPAVQILFEQVCRADAGVEASLLGFARRSSVLTAALLHGTAAHALDYDDTHWGLQGHPSAPVLGALWGLAERERASGAALIAALIAGVEVECRLGRRLNPSHYARGFHATGTLGTFGAAAAAAHLLGLDEVAWIRAFGLAGTQAAGLKSAFGSMAKPLHAGKAAHAGLMSALLAASGFSASEQIFDDAQGFVATHASLPLTEAHASEQPEILHTLFKYHAACHLTHATIEGLRAMLRDDGIAPPLVERVELTVDETCLGVCAIEDPRDGMQAKFSLKATAAMALLGDPTEDPRAFTAERATAADVRALMQRVALRVAAMPATRTEIRVQLRDGSVRSTVHDSGVPEPDLARQRDRLLEKFERLAPLSAAKRKALGTAVLRLDQLTDLRELRAYLE